nr:hypothetical protein [Cellulomonas pakistanensis]
MATVQRDADDLVRQAESIESTGTSIGSRTVAQWEGTAADGYADRRDELARRLSAVGQVYRFAADALSSYADVLAWGQGRAAYAVELWDRGARQSLEAARQPGRVVLGDRVVGNAMPPTSASDPGLAVKQQAQAVLTDARSVVAAAGDATAAVLSQLSEGLPDGKWHASSFAGGVWSWLKGIVSMAWDFSLVRVVVDPDGAATSAVAVWDSATGAYRLITEDPIGSVDVLADGQTRRDDPARWWGQLAPDIALTAVGGAGVAARVASGARAGHRIEESMVVTERVTVGRTGYTADELMTPTPGDGPMSFQFKDTWSTDQLRNASEHLDLANAARLRGELAPDGRVSTAGELRDAADYAARQERLRAERAGDPYGDQVAGHGPDTTWTGQPEPPFWQRQDSSVNSSFGAQARGFPLGSTPTIFEGRLPDGTLIRGSWDWSPQ